MTMNATATVTPIKTPQADPLEQARRDHKVRAEIVAPLVKAALAGDLTAELAKIDAMYTEARKLAREAYIASLKANDAIADCVRAVYALADRTIESHDGELASPILDAFGHYDDDALQWIGRSDDWGDGEGAKWLARLEATETGQEAVSP